MRSNLDKPLGEGAPRGRRSGKSTIAFRPVLAICIGVAIASLAGYVALTPEGLRAPDAEAVSAPDAPQMEAATVPKEAVTAKPADVRQNSAGLQKQTMPDGATVTTFRPSETEIGGPRIIEGMARGQDLRMAHLPEDALIEETAYGRLPTIGPDGRRPVDAYARSWSGTRGTRIAIVVGGLGLSQTGTKYAIEQLPEEITLAFAPNGNSLNRWMQAARRDGHELLVQIPMEPFGYPAVDPGADTLTTDAEAAENLARLRRSLAQITNYTGVMNYMGGRFLASAEAMEPFMREMVSRGLLFLDDGSSAQSRAKLMSRTIGVPFAESEIILDIDRSHAAILKQLDALERSAVRNGSAIGVASAFETSVRAIAAWAEEASTRNIEIVGVAAIADDPARQ